MFEKFKQKRAARRAAEQQAEAQRNAQAWREYFAAAQTRLQTARTFFGVSGADAAGCPIVLKKDEKMYCTASGAVLVEPRRTPGHWQGANQGISVRVPGTKSMRYRVGTTRGTYVQGEEKPTAIDSGTFTITDARAVFVGEKASREWLWSKLLGITHATDAPWTAIAVSNRQKTSGIAVDAAHIDTVRFWIDLAVANVSGTRDALVHELETQLAEQHHLVDASIAGVPALEESREP